MWRRRALSCLSPRLRRTVRWSVRAGLALLALSLMMAAPGASAQPQLQKAEKPNLQAIKKMSVNLRPEDDRLRTAPTAWWWYHGVSGGFIGEKLKEHRARIVDLEIESASPARFSVVMVKNEGAYAARWWWYHGLRGVGAVASKVNEADEARLIDLERLEVRTEGGREPRYAIVLVDNTGSHERTWRRHFNDPVSTLDSTIAGGHFRLADLEDHRSPGAPGRWGAVLLANKGTEARAWWWYRNVTPGFITARLNQHDARLTDIERAGDGRFHVVMVESKGEGWWWYHGVSAEGLARRLSRNHARLIDLEPYRVGGEKRFAAIMVKN